MKFNLGIIAWAPIVFIWICQVGGSKPFVITIGALFERGQGSLPIALHEAVRHINEDANLLKNSILVANIEIIDKGDTFDASRKVCKLLSQGVSAIFGPQSPDTSVHVESICKTLEIPHVLVQLPHSFTKWDIASKKASYTFNVAPHAPAYYNLFQEMVGYLKWTSFAIIYDSDAGIQRIKGLIPVLPQQSSNVTAHQLPSGDDYRKLLLEIQKQDQYNVIVDCLPDQTFRLLKYAQQIGMMGERYTYILTNTFDAEEKDFEDFRYSKSTILYTKLVNPMSPYLMRLEEKSSLKFNTQMALLYDAVLFFAKLITKIEEPFIDNTAASCETETIWSNGSYVRSHMQLMKMEGIGGSIELFNQHRTSFHVDVMRMGLSGVEQIGNYSIEEYGDLQVHITNLDKTEASLTLNVLAILNEPYVMIKNNRTLSTNNEDIYEGFCIDILDEISKINGFSYNISLVHDNSYGSIHATTGEFTGIIGELIKEKADMGIGDITITKRRHQVVDFSHPFLDVGIIALVRKPSPDAQNDIFYFLTPFSAEIWITLAAVYLGASTALFALARINPTEWINPNPSSTNSQYLCNNLGFSNCFWFMLASLLRQWSTVTPRGCSTRLLALVWWLFAIIIFCFYVANLVKNNLIAVDEMESPVRNIHDLLGQSKIKYGAVRGGATMDFFRNSKIEVYQEMWSIMVADEQNHPNQNTFAKSTLEGLERVKRGDYAFFMEAPASEYIAERDCSLTTVGPQMDHKGHGFAFPSGSQYRDRISASIVKLQQTGILRKLKAKWWEHSKSRGHCDDDKLQKIKTINSRHLGGLFILLFSIVLLACLVAIVEVIWNWSRTRSYNKDNTLGQEILRQLLFAVNFKKSTKLVSIRPSIEEERPIHQVNDDENQVF